MCRKIYNVSIFPLITISDVPKCQKVESHMCEKDKESCDALNMRALHNLLLLPNFPHMCVYDDVC